jgi:hypothetical protein
MRGSALQKRVAIMQAWADFCAKPRRPGKVIPGRWPVGNAAART